MATITINVDNAIAKRFAACSRAIAGNAGEDAAGRVAIELAMAVTKASWAGGTVLGDTSRAMLEHIRFPDAEASPSDTFSRQRLIQLGAPDPLANSRS